MSFTNFSLSADHFHVCTFVSQAREGWPDASTHLQHSIGEQLNSIHNPFLHKVCMLKDGHNEDF